MTTLVCWWLPKRLYSCLSPSSPLPELGKPLCKNKGSDRGRWKCNFSAFLGNYDRPTTDKPNEQPTNQNKHILLKSKVTLPINKTHDIIQSHFVSLQSFVRIPRIAMPCRRKYAEKICNHENFLKWAIPCVDWDKFSGSLFLDRIKYHFSDIMINSAQK